MRRPGLIAFIVLLFCIGIGALGFLPLERPLRWLGQAVIAPISDRMRDVTTDERDRESAALRQALRSILGETLAAREEQSRTRSEERMQVWSQTHGLTAPIIARVIGQTTRGGRRIFLLDRGAEDGVTAEAPVIMDDGVYVGRVESVTPRRALVVLASAVGNTFAVNLANAGATPGLAKGEGEELPLTVDFVPSDRTAAPNDVVQTAGLDDELPRGLLVGTVTDVRVTDQSPWKQLIVTPLVRPADLFIVGVLQKETP